jgi:sortase (surface protein transpeptidase)
MQLRIPVDTCPAGVLCCAMPAMRSRPDPPAWDVDADWWGPTWDVVTSVGAPEPAHRAEPGDVAASVGADQIVSGPAPPHVAAADPSWGQILATTIRLWVSRRSRRPRVAGQASRPGAVSRTPHPVVAGRESRFRLAGRASAVWAAHARGLSAAMLCAGLLAAGAGAAGLLVAHTSSARAARLVAPPSPVAAPSGRTILPVSLSTVQQTPRPVWLTIPAIGVKAPVIDLGLNRNGTLQVPASTTVAGWYTNSPRPGATGSAIIAGHVDSRSGPGVFFWLRAMRPGERIYVRRADGTLAVFTVTAVQKYAKDHFPTATVYGPVPDAELRLITCGGTFDYARGSYLSNVVVYARLGG